MSDTDTLKKSIIIVIIIVVCEFGFPIIWKKITPNKDKAIENHIDISTLPKFQFISINANNKFTEQNIPSDKSIVITFFDTLCDSCCTEIKKLSQDPLVIKEAVIILVSMQGIESLRQFDKVHRIQNPSLYLLSDSAWVFDDIFGTATVPSTFYYSKDHTLYYQSKNFNADALRTIISNQINESQHQ